ncbi:MAG TPA: spore coat U domain-containing protein [Vicinamibacterales bacterium]|jgi:spore coat protein U-like protein|nr:spore coat U domain-containing protein [Vicinamibacterales bacterium]
MKRIERNTTAILGSLCAACVLAAATAVEAGSASTSLALSASVASNCTIASSAVSFGTYDPVVGNVSSNLDGTGSVTVACTKGATATIALNLGANASGSTRRLGDGSGNFLTYEIYQDSSRVTVWSNSGGGLLTPAAAPSAAPRSFTAYGRVASGQDVPPGSYTDSVTATVNF